MTTKQLRLLSHVSVTLTTLIGLQQYANVEMLDCCALESFEILGARVGTAAKAGIHAINNMTRLKLALEKRDRVVYSLEDIFIVSQTRYSTVAEKAVALVVYGKR